MDPILVSFICFPQEVLDYLVLSSDTYGIPCQGQIMRGDMKVLFNCLFWASGFV
jgi:hypothetical protein